MRKLSRAAAAGVFVAVVAVSSPGNVRADAGATEVIGVVPVNASGQAINGFRVINRQASPDLSGCVRPSPAAVRDNIYACDPDQAAAQVCWPAPASVLCLVDPWSKTLRRFPSPGSLPAVNPPATPMPFALRLDDGTPCVLPSGVDLGGRADERFAAYFCGRGASSQGVLVDPGQDPASAIDRSKPVWTVRVGQLGPPLTPLGFLTQHNVTTAWFAA
ncbi:MAG TPA: hypothetical protein VFB19_10715 [Mycobacterium sp.]|nr:hypothetical protein [Mycobacterium sp.]